VIRRGTTLRALALGLGCVALVALAVGVTRMDLGAADGAQSAGPAPTLPIAATTNRSNPTPARPKSDSGRATELGVFEPIRGWIVYPIGDRLEAVNPADPAERHVLKLPAGLNVLLGGGPDGGNRPMPAGWAADGRTLALSHEYSGDHFVMHADGSVTRVLLGPGGCCLFVAEPWLSPDGTTGLARVSRDGIAYVHLASGSGETRMLDPPLRTRERPWLNGAWSADGSRIAVVTVADGMIGAQPTLHVADFSSGSRRMLARLDAGHVRHVVWSPDDSQILVVAGEPLPRNFSLNPLVSVQPTRLLLVATDGSGVRAIASGHYVATSWSPDGTQIAAIEYGAARTLVVMNADGTGKRVLVELPTTELFTGVAWHPLPDKG
jgi:hypothetical protein